MQGEMGTGVMRGKRTWGLAAALMLGAAVPAQAQFSDGYNFLKAVKDGDGEKVTAALNKPGTGIVNTRDYTTGETALHLVAKRRDATYLSFLLGRGAKADARDTNGDTPMIIATRLGWAEGIATLAANGGGVNVANNGGETPLILAVHNRDLETVRLLLGAGANPRQADRATGKTPIDYATEDSRAGAVLKVLQEAPKRVVSGPVAGPN